MRQILEGKNSKRLFARFHKMDQEQNEGFDYHVSVLNVLSGKIENPEQYYQEHRKHSDVRERANAISIFSCPVAFDITSEFPQYSEDVRSTLKEELLGVLNEENPILQQAALWGLHDCSLVESPEDWNCYLNGFVRYTNKMGQLLCVAHAISFPATKIPYKKEVELTDHGFHRLLNAIKKYPVNIKTYGRLVTLAFLGVVACGDNQNVVSILHSLRETRKKCAELGSINNILLYYCDQPMHRLLNMMILDSDCSEVKKTAVREHILKTDFDWATTEDNVIISSYCDYSADEPVSLEPDGDTDVFFCEKYADQVIAHIQSRMEELGIG